MKPRGILAGWLAVTAFVFALAVRGQLSLEARADAPRPLPRFSMAAANSGGPASLSLEDLAGAPWVASFIFTRCAGPCPLITRRMAGLQRDLPDAVRLVSFTVDPDRDVPEVLERYAALAGAKPGRWVFLRGDKGRLYRLMHEGFRLAVAEDRRAPSGFRVTHGTHLALVDGAGGLRGLYAHDDDRALARLRRDAQRLVREARGAPGT